MPYCPEIISAVTSENQDVPIPMLRPVTIEGKAPGNITSRNIANGEAPSVKEAKINLSSSVETPWIVLSRIGKNAPTKVIKIILSSELGNIRIANGIHWRNTSTFKAAVAYRVPKGTNALHSANAPHAMCSIRFRGKTPRTRKVRFRPTRRRAQAEEA